MVNPAVAIRSAYSVLTRRTKKSSNRLVISLARPLFSTRWSIVRRAGIDEDETEAIALALSMRPAATVILDDVPARRVALNAGLDVTGTGGAVVLAKQFGLVSIVGPTLRELRAAGLYLSDSTLRRFIELAGER